MIASSLPPPPRHQHPQCFHCNYKSTQTLWLSHCRPLLLSLDLSHNHLCDLYGTTATLQGMRSLRSLMLTGNPITVSTSAYIHISVFFCTRRSVYMLQSCIRVGYHFYNNYSVTMHTPRSLLNAIRNSQLIVCGS